jgi:hypothetical protein
MRAVVVAVSAPEVSGGTNEITSSDKAVHTVHVQLPTVPLRQPRERRLVDLAQTRRPCRRDPGDRMGALVRRARRDGVRLVRVRAPT